MKLLAAGFPPYAEKNVFQSHWQLTQRCNFHCEYCVNRHLRHEGIFMPLNIMRHALLKISELDSDHYHFCLSGGEVTLYPHLDEMLSEIARLFPKGTTVNLMSNGSATHDRMRFLLSANPGLNCRFIIAVHLGQTNMPKLAQKLQQFTEEERKAHFTIKIITPPGDKRGPQAAQTLENHGIHEYSLLPVLNFQTGEIAHGYTPEEMAMFLPGNGKKPWFYFRHTTPCACENATFLEGMAKGLFHYRGMTCAAGRQSIFLDEHGTVSKGQFCGHMPYTIMEKNPFEDPAFFNPAPCQEEHCSCIPFTSLPKWSDAAYAPASCQPKNVHPSLEK